MKSQQKLQGEIKMDWIPESLSSLPEQCVAARMKRACSVSQSGRFPTASGPTLVTLLMKHNTLQVNPNTGY